MSVLEDDAGEFSAGAAGDGAIVIDHGGDYLCASFGVSDTSLGDHTGGGMRHQAASAIAQQAGGCFVIKVSEDACGCADQPIRGAMMDVFDRCKMAVKVPIHSSRLHVELASALGRELNPVESATVSLPRPCDQGSGRETGASRALPHHGRR